MLTFIKSKNSLSICETVLKAKGTHAHCVVIYSNAQNGITICGNHFIIRFYSICVLSIHLEVLEYISPELKGFAISMGEGIFM